MTEEVENGGGRIASSRRDLLRNAGLVAGAAWVVPAVLSLDVPTASASPGGCTSCNTIIGTAPEIVTGGTGTAADLASWVAPSLTAPGSPFAAVKAQSTGSQFQASGNPPSNGNKILSGLQQTITLSSLCTTRIALGGVTFQLEAFLDAGATFSPCTGFAGACPNVPASSTVRVQWYTAADVATGGAVTLSTDSLTGATQTSALTALPTNAAKAVVTVYLWVWKGSLTGTNYRALADNISLKLVCP